MDFSGDDTTYAFARSNDHETVIVVLNKGKVNNKPSVPVSDYFPDGTILWDALTGKTVSVSGGRIEHEPARCCSSSREPGAQRVESHLHWNA